MTILVEVDQMAPFSIAATPKYRGVDAAPFPGLIPFTFDTYLIMENVNQEGIKYHFLSFWYDLTWDWTPVYQTIGEHSTPLTNEFVHLLV